MKTDMSDLAIVLTGIATVIFMLLAIGIYP